MRSASDSVPDAHCLSVVCPDRTLDLECPNVAQRDTIVKNLKRLLARLSASAKK